MDSLLHKQSQRNISVGAVIYNSLDCSGFPLACLAVTPLHFDIAFVETLRCWVSFMHVGLLQFTVVNRFP